MYMTGFTLLRYLLSKVLFIFVVFASAPVFSQEIGSGVEDKRPIISGIGSTDQVERLEVEQNLIRFRNDLLDELRDIFHEYEGDNFDGARHVAIRQMGVWRFEEVVSALAKEINWSINERTLPLGKKYPRWIIFPAAIALREIGGTTVRAEMVSIILSTGDDTKLKLSSWVLSGVDGAQSAVKRLSEVRARVDDDLLEERLKTAEKYVELGDAVFAE